MAQELQRLASGRRDRLVEIQEWIGEDVGESGMPVPQFRTLCRVRAQREDVQAPERFTEGFVSDQMSARVWSNWVVPYRADYDPELEQVPKKRRLIYKGREYDIVDSSPIDRKKGVRFTTLAKVG